MLKTSFHCIYIFFFFSLFINGCSPLLEPVQERDYSLEELQEFESLKKKNEIFNRMKGIDAALFFSKEDFSVLVDKSFEKFSQHFTDLEGPDFSNVSFAGIELELGNQKISSKIKFSFEVDALKRKLFGHLRAEHILKAGKNAFFLNTNFDEIILEGIEEIKPLEKNSQNRDFIASSVKSFMHTLNIEIINMPLRVPVNMNILSNVNGKDIVSSSDYKLHSARAVNMQTKMEVYLPYICAKGVTFLGSGELQTLKEEKFEDLILLRDRLNKKIDLSLGENMGISFDTLQKYSSFYISKTYLSKKMNLALVNMDLRMINKSFIQIPEEDRGLKKEIYFFNKDSLPPCSDVKKDCLKLLHSCDLQCELKFGVNRCEKCEQIVNPFEKVRCMSKSEACKSKEELHIYECHKHENRCELKNSKIQSACDIQNLEEIEVCKEKKEKLLFVNDEIVLGQLNLDFDLSNSYVVQRIKQVVFDKELDSLDVIRDIHISVDSKLQLTFKNSQHNDINCSLQIDEALLTHSQADHLQEIRNLPLLTQNQEDGKMLIKAISKEDFLTSQLHNKPYEKLIKTKKFSLQCTYQGMPMKPINADKLLAKKDIPYELNAMLGEVELQFEKEELSFAVSPVQLADDIFLYPTMESKAIGFSRQAHFY